MPFTITKQDITQMSTDAIVNAANTRLAMGGGVCGAIFRAAGEREMTDACSKLSPIQTGQAVITPGFALKAKYVIHTPGPIYNVDNAQECEEQLRSSYSNSLKLAHESGCKSISFPLISSGIFGYPKKEALKVASSVIEDFLKENEMDVYLAIVDKTSFAIAKELFGDSKTFLERQ